MTRAHPDVVEQIVCERFRLPFDKLRAREKHRAVAYPRMLAMYMLRQHGYKVTEIGRLLQRDHGTVCSGIRRIERALETDPVTREHVSAINRRLPSRIVFNSGVSF